MAQTSRSGKEQRLPVPLHRRLNGYALAASAAGAGLLALTLPSEAEIVYTPANGLITRNMPFTIDLNGDGIVDFTIIDHAKANSFRSSQFLDVSMAQGNAAMCGWVACSSGFSFAGAFLAGVKVGASYYAWMSRRALMAWEESSRGQSFSSGSWAHRSVHPARYLGLQFHIHGETHFGWARLSVRFQKNSPRTWEVHVSGYAYETIPDKPIIAGQTAENDDNAAIRPNSAPINDSGSLQRGRPLTAPRFATLGALALGVDGLALWRREEAIESCN